MNVIVDRSQLKRTVSREQLRTFNNKNGTKLSRDELEKLLLIQRLRMGTLDEQDVKTMAKNRIAHLDNEEKFPNGIEVKLNYEEIKKRNKTDFTEEYWKWINDNRDVIFHLDREENQMNLVCLEEDVRFNDSGERIPRWLFDMYSDLLVKNENGEWTEPFNIDDITEGKSEF